MPNVAVIIPTRGPAPFLTLAVTSALRQDHTDIEVVIVRDEPERSSPWSIPDDGRVRVISHDRARGVSAARNTGIAAARAEWIAFLDDDDLWSPRKLTRQLAAAEASGRSWVYTGAVGIDARNRVRYVEPVPEPAALLERLPALNVVPTSNVLVRREALDAAGPFDVDLRLTEDWDLYLRLARLAPPAFVRDHLVAFRTHPDQSSLRVSGLLAELDRFERRHAVVIERAAILRGAAWACLRANRRADAFRLYGHAIRRGDVGSVARAAVAALPRMMRTRVLERASSMDGDGTDAQRWIDEMIGSA